MNAKHNNKCVLQLGVLIVQVEQGSVAGYIVDLWAAFQSVEQKSGFGDGEGVRK